AEDGAGAGPNEPLALARGDRDLSVRRARAVEARRTRLDEVEDARLEADAVEDVDLLDPRRAGDVHLRHQAADDVEADEPEPVAAQPRRRATADLPVALVDRRAHDAAADVDVAAVLVVPRHP